MLFGDLNLEKTLGFINMEIDCVTNDLAEEGEISDSASVEEISEEAFTTKQTPLSVVSPILQQQKSNLVLDKTNVIKNSTGATTTNNNGGRVWTMNDVYKYRISSTTSYSGLYNLAWAQAVNNKPLDEVFVMMEDSQSKGKEVDGNVEDGKVVIEVEDDGEKEEGEIEEGEIDLDSGTVVKNEGMDVEVVDESNGVSEREREKRVDSIRRELQSLSVVDANKSFDGLCSSLKDLADRLMKLVLEVSSAEKESLVKLLFSVILNANTVYSSMNLGLKDLNRDILTRLLTHVKSLNPPLFSSLQLNEMEAIMFSLSSIAYSFSNGDDTKTKQVDGGFSNSGLLMFEHANKDSTFLKKCEIETPLTGLVNHKQKGMALPLLDLHKDHDVDSLPSPTREPSVPLPFDKGYSFSQGSLKPEWPKTRRTTGSPIMHPYETEAVKAVSSYQQKFSRSSIYMKDELPSPTPSEEVETGDCEMSEVSSSIIQKVSSAVNSPSLEQPVASSVNTSISQQSRDPRLGYTASNNANPLSRSSSARSRDPRLRLNQGLPIVENHEPVVNSRKQKTSDELVSDGPMLKRQRSDSAVVNVTGGWLEDKGTVGVPNVSRSLVNSVTMPIISNHGNDKSAILPVSVPITKLPTSSAVSTSLVSSQATALPVKDMTATTSLDSLLRDIAVNPSILMSMLKTEYQRSPNYNKCATEIPTSNPINRAPPGSSVPGHIFGGAIQAPPPATPMEESGKVRMKPRDPRRILHNNAAKIGGTADVDQPKVNTSITSATSSNSGTSTQNDQQDKLATSSTTKPPDITKEFTNNLKNIADILSVTQASTSPPIIPQIPSSQPVSESGNSRKLVPEKVNVGPPRPLKANAWSDVEHLFDGFDDTQKAAIQKERARRLDEQKKLFTVRKLCLVLDLDHTLLNSAKFVEVEPLHEDLLRKKEEQDREKAYRHLFRFPHMGMWTKLRPGIWNFLEKASKLFELHLYTMGNKSYATEMAKLLDPKGELFSGRVVSRGDDGEPFDGDDNVPKTKDLEGVLGMESSVIIIDDSVRVWPHNKPNLIAVERYIYFPCSRRQFGLPGPSLLEIDHDERPEEGTLAASLAVIERIHQNFFAQESLDEADVRNILASEQQKILGGCRIVFSRVFPVGEAKPHMHPLWQTAEQFGAVCTNQLDDRVTHVVANSLGTDKVNWALSNGKFVVHPGWVEASALLYRRANEHDFAIKQQ